MPPEEPAPSLDVRPDIVPLQTLNAAGSRAPAAPGRACSSSSDRSEHASSSLSTTPLVMSTPPLGASASVTRNKEVDKVLDSTTGLAKLDTSIPLPGRSRSDSDLGPQSVVHAPHNFKQFTTNLDRPSLSLNSSQTVSASSSTNTKPSATPRRSSSGTPKASAEDTKERPPLPLYTDIPIEQAFARERDTPEAQTRQDAEVEKHLHSRPSSNVGDVSVNQIQGTNQNQSQDRSKSGRYPTKMEKNTSCRPSQYPQAILRNATESKKSENVLNHSWTLCNSLAGFSGILNIQDQALQHSWGICQKLYDARAAGVSCHVKDLLKDFRKLCQALYDSRQKSGEPTDSVLRVLWELQIHFYNVQDENLPDAFQERTLDFYVTLCHRLIKQQSTLSMGTDRQLRACWSLVEALMSLREVSLGDKDNVEELLGTAVKACMDLCELFRQGWTQVRSDKTTPRPSQTAFLPYQSSGKGSFLGRSPPALSRSSSTARSQIDLYDMPHAIPPETPTTIFDDNPMDALDEHHNTPNILVLGTKSSSAPSNHHWPSSVSDYTESSQLTSPTATVNTSKSYNLAAIRTLLVKAAVHAGFRTRSPTPSASSSRTENSANESEALLAFVKSMPSHSFGPQAWQSALVEKYRRMVFAWPSIVSSLVGGNGGVGGRFGNAAVLAPMAQQDARHVFGAAQVAAAVQWMMKSEHYTWLGDLYRVLSNEASGYDEDDDDDNDDDDEEAEVTDEGEADSLMS